MLINEHCDCDCELRVFHFLIDVSSCRYCNAVLAGLPKVTIAPLQRAQNAAARLILRLAPHDHVTAALCHLHWIPVQYRITYKLCLLMHLIHIHKGTILSQRHCHCDSISQFSWTASVREQFPLRDETQIWSALFLTCCTSRLEHYRHHCNNSLTLTHLNGS